MVFNGLMAYSLLQCGDRQAAFDDIHRDERRDADAEDDCHDFFDEGWSQFHIIVVSVLERQKYRDGHPWSMAGFANNMYLRSNHQHGMPPKAG